MKEDPVARDGVLIESTARQEEGDLFDYGEHIPGRLQAIGIHRLRHQRLLAYEQDVAVGTAFGWWHILRVTDVRGYSAPLGTRPLVQRANVDARLFRNANVVQKPAAIR